MVKDFLCFNVCVINGLPVPLPMNTQNIFN